jgi:imidazolonepropionase-like amidohydrolase
MEEAKVKVVKAKRLIDGNGGEISDATVIIEGERIREVGKESNVKQPTHAQVLDMGDQTIMPGLIDAHLHLAGHNIATYINYRVAQLEVPPPTQLLHALLHAQMCFEMGYTTMRDHNYFTCYGGQMTSSMVSIRDAINNGLFAGPRLLTSGFAMITNSHLEVCLPVYALREEDFTADGPYGLRRQVRQQLRLGCDFIKTSASGGGGTDKEAPDIRNMTQEEIDAIVDEAHAFDKPCACHCFTPTSQKMAIRAGVDTIEHCVFTDDEAIAMIKDAGVYLVPTLSHRSDRSIEVRRQTGASEFVLKKMKSIQPYTKETFQRLHEAGIKIAMGTDIEIDPDMASNSMELEIYVNYGMTPMEAIQTATKNASEAIGLDKEVGTIEQGKLADIVVVDGNPLKDIGILQKRDKITMVMKEGKIYVDKGEGSEKSVIADQNWAWKRS